MTRINTNVSSLNAQKNLARSNVQLQTALTRLSTGLRINSGKDDPAGLIAGVMLGSEIVGTNTAISNTELANQIISTADSALSQISSLLEDIRALVEEAANTGALSAEQISANQLQVDSSLDAINRIAQTTQFQGRQLLDGSLDYITENVDSTKLSNLLITSANFGTASEINVDVQVATQATRGTLNYTGQALSTDVVIDITGNIGTQTLALGAGTTAAQVAAAVNQVSDSTGVTATLADRVSQNATAGQITLMNENMVDGLTFTSASTGRVAGDFAVKYVATAGTAATTASWAAGTPNVLQINLATTSWTTAAAVGGSVMSAATTAATTGSVTVATNVATGTFEVAATGPGEDYGLATLTLTNSGGGAGVTGCTYSTTTKVLEVTCGVGTTVNQIATAITGLAGTPFAVSNIVNGATSLVQLADFGLSVQLTQASYDQGSLDIAADVAGSAFSGAHLTLVNSGGGAGVTDIYYDYENKQIMVTCGVGTTTAQINTAITNTLGSLFTTANVTNGATSAVALADFGDKGAVTGAATDGGTVTANFTDILTAVNTTVGVMEHVTASAVTGTTVLNVVDLIECSGSIGDMNVGDSDDPNNRIQLTGTALAAHTAIDFVTNGASQPFSIDYDLNTRTMGKSTALIQASTTGGVLQVQAVNQGTDYDGYTVSFVQDAALSNVALDKQNKTITVTTDLANTTLTNLAALMDESIGNLFTTTVVSGDALDRIVAADSGVTRDGQIYDGVTVNLATDANGTATTTAAEVVTAINASAALGNIDITASHVTTSTGAGVMDTGTVTLSQVGVTAVNQAASGTTFSLNADAGITVTAKTTGSAYDNVRMVVVQDATAGSEYASYNSGDKTLTFHISSTAITAANLVNTINTGSGTSVAVKDLFTFSSAGVGNVSTSDVGWLGTTTPGVIYTGISQGGTESQGNFDAGQVVGAKGVALSAAEYGSSQFVALDVISGTFVTTKVVGTVTRTADRAAGTDAVVRVNGNTAVTDGLNVSLSSASLSLGFRLASTLTAGSSFNFDITGGGAKFQLGSQVISGQQVSVGIGSISTTHLGGLSGLLYQLKSGNDASLTNNVVKAGAIVDEAIVSTATFRGRLGAFQKTTLDTNVATLEDTVEALTEAKSTIMDADFAAESANLTRAQILSQSGIAVLTIANQRPQQVLALLQGQ